MKRQALLLLFSIVTTAAAYSQEICNNGIDDDGDGFIDCYDKKCAGNAACAGSFLGNDVICQAKPTAFPQFSMKLKWQSPNKTTNHLNRASVGDLDKDGIPEVVVNEIEGDYIYILNGKDGTIKKSLYVGGSYSLDRDPLIANIDNSSCAWIFVTGGNNIYAYDCNLNFKWKSTTLSAAPYLIGIADFDGDGKSEIYCRDEIIAAESGIRIVKGTNSSNASGGPVAVDILDATGNVAGTGDNKLELISGCNIFSVNLGTRTLNSGSLTLKKSAANYFYWQNNGNTSLTSVVDYNQDGKLDIIATGSTGSMSANATVFFWDVQNNAVKTYIDKIAGTFNVNSCPPSSGAFYANGWHNGIGRVNVADIDGDGKLNAAYISGKYMYALDENFNQKWRIPVNEETSGYTGCTVYDFNGDGAAEVVYRDEQFLYIINGNNGSINTQQQCIARTSFDYPVVSDLDGDGTTELCVTCGSDDALAWANFCNLSYSQNACVRVFQSAGVPWVPSRKLWNQHGYFNVNVNDDLTIPKIMQKQTAVFSTGVCTVTSNRPLNSFLNQSPFLDSKGCPTYASPDLVNVQALFKVTPPTCPNTDFIVTVGVKNQGDVTINGNVPITFYNGDPTKVGATKLNTITIPVNLTKNQTQTFAGLTVTGTGSSFKLYIVLNDAGTSVPTPIVLPNTAFLECDYGNVISADVVPKSVKITATKINDNVKCVGAAVPDNGAATASVGGNTIDYNFYWFNGAVAGAPSYTGVSYSGLAAGTYKVFATHKTANCNSDTASVTIIRVDKAPMIASIVVDKPNTSCSSPNGQMHAVVNGGDPINNYTYKWYEGNDIFTSPEVGVGYIASNLKGGKTYTVLVTDIASGCQTITSLAVPDNTVSPVVSAIKTDAVCVPANSGSVSANVGGATAGYTFNWYNGAATKPSPDFTGVTYNSIPAGSYTVTATENTSGCLSLPVTVSVNLPPPFTVNTSMLTQQTSCNPATPNGSATADVGGITAGYTFNWFKGQSTAAANAIAGPTNLASGVYTVKATNNATGCTATNEVTITQNLTYPVVSLTPSPNSTCDPTKGTNTFNGSVAATVTYNGTPVVDPVGANFSLVWHNGALATDPVIGGNTTSISQLNGGSYTLVVTRTDVVCAAAPVTATVTNTTSLPALTTNQTPSTNCAGGTLDGIAEVTKVNGIAVGFTANFTYKWHTGLGTGSPIAGATNAKLSNLQGGAASNFTVLVTDKTSGCQNTATVLVADAKVLPAITLVPTDNTICAPATSFNGKVTTTVTSPVGAYTYDYLPAGGAQPGGNTNNVYSVLNGGVTYSVTVTQTATNCKTTSSVAVNNNQVKPTITTTVTGSTNCAGGTKDGSMTVSSVTPADTYSYRWFDSTPLQIPAEFGTTLANRQGGTGQTYTVEVTLNSTGCFATANNTIPDKSKLPVITLVPTDNTICAPATSFNGKVTTTVTSPVGAYTYDYLPAGGAQPGGNTNNVYSVLNGGVTYSVTVTQTATNCKTTSSVAVNNNQVKPTITTTVTGSTNCAGGTKDGSMTVSSVTPADTYSYRWFDSTPLQIPAEFGATLANRQGGAGQTYTVEVTLNSTGCLATANNTIPDNKALPTLALSKVDNTICDNTLTNPRIPYNGQVNVTGVTYKGAPYALASPLTYKFYNNGTGAGAPSQSNASVNYLNQNGGTYSATVTIDDLNCTSNAVSIVVGNNLAPVNILTSIDPSTNCQAGKENGAAHVNKIDGFTNGVNPQVIANYKYQWYNSNTVDPLKIMGGQTNPDIGSTTPGSGLQGGTATSTYTVLAIRNSDGCQNNATATITDARANPVVSISLNKNNTICAGTPDGSLHATVTYKGVTQSSPLAANWVVSWPTFPNGEDLNAIPAGNYTATVLDNNTGCTSVAAAGVVADQFDIPVISVSVLAKQTSCNLGTPNGQLQGSATDGPAGSTLQYNWYPGLGTVGSFASATGQSSGALFSTVATLASNNYTFRAKNEVTGCESTKSIFLPQQLTYPTFSGNVSSHVTSCVPTNGVLDITLTSITDPTQFTIYYLNEINSARTGDPAVVKATATATFTNDPTKLKYHADPPAISVGNPGLAPGTYTVLVRDEKTQCESNVQTFTVNDNTNKTVTVSAIVNASACNSGVGGKIDISVLPAAAYTYSWHTGVPTNNNFNFMNNANLPTFAGGDPVSQTTEDLTGFFNGDTGGVGKGIFTVVITDAVGCGKVYSDNIPFTNAPTVTLTLTNSSKCDPTLSDASVQVNVVGSAGVTYAVRLFKGHDSAIAGTWINGEDDGCSNGIDDDGDLLTDMADPDCGVMNANTTFNMTSKKLTGSLPVPLLGDYLVRVFDNSGGGCALEKVLTLDTDPKVPNASVDFLDPSTACAGGLGDGRVELTVNNDPQDKTNLALKNYQITAIVPPAIGTALPQSLTAGTPTFITGTFDAQSYQVTIKDQTSGCKIDQFVNVPSQPGLPTAFVVTPTADEFCAPSTNGSALVTTLTGFGNFTNYKFEWYKDNALSTLVAPIAVGDGTSTGGELLTATEVIAFNPANWPLGAIGSGNGNKTFYARAQKQGSKGDKCYTQVAQVNIDDTHIAPQITLTPFSNTSCNGTPEGRIELTTVTASGTPAISSSTYTYSWMPDPAGGNASPMGGQNGAATFTISALPSNTYNVTAFNAASSCTSTNITTVQNNKFDITITAKNIVDQVLCPTDGRIDVTQITIDRSITGESTILVPGFGASNLSTDFTYQWFNATPGNPGTFNPAPIQDSSPANITGVSLVAGNGAQQNPTMGTGTYYVIATRTATAILPGAGCPSNPLRVDVGDQRVFPTVSFETTASTSCDTNYDGSIKVTATTASGPGAGANYDFAWQNDPDGMVATVFKVSSRGNNVVSPQTFLSEALGGAGGERIGPGRYDITVKNFVTGCPTTASVNVLNNVVPFAVTPVTGFSTTDRDLCNSTNGSAGVVQLTLNGSTINGAALGTDYSYVWQNSVPATVSTNQNTGTILDFGNYSVVVTKSVAAPQTATTPASGCSTAPFAVNIKDNRIFPTVSFETIASTSCDTNYDGSIKVTATTASGPGAGANYDFAWQNDPDGMVATVFKVSSRGNNVVSPQTFLSEALGGAGGERIGPGRYDITVKNFVTGCPTTASVNVLNNVVPFAVTPVTGFSTTDRDLCNSTNGSAGVVQLTLNGSTINGAALGTDYSYVWQNSVPATVSTNQNTGTILDFGNYSVVVTKSVAAPQTATTPASGCSTAPFAVNIKDLRAFPNVSFDITKANTSCDNNFDGSIQVNTSTQGFGAGTLYDFTWTADPDGLGGMLYTVTNSAVPFPAGKASPYTTQAGDKVGSSNTPYAITVTNLTNGCTGTGTVVMPQNIVPFKVSDVVGFTKTDRDNCGAIGDGSAGVVQVELNGATINNAAILNADFSYDWKKDNVAPTISTSRNTGAILSEGNYFVTVSRTNPASPGSGCSTAPFEVDIKDIHIDPTVVGNPSPDTNCAGGAGAGSITLSQPATPLNFNYAWVTGDNINTGASVATVGGVNNKDALSLQEGDYTVRVTEIATGCSTVESFEVINSPTIVSFDPAGFSAPAVTTCNVLTGVPSNGSATVISILENNVSQPLGNYTFLWKDANNNVLQNGAAPAMNNISAGTYFVTATNTVSNCIADLQFKIDDQTIGSTTVTLNSFQQPEQCINRLNGSLTVLAGGTVPGPFTFEWFNGDQRPPASLAGQPVIATGSTLNNIPVASGQIFTVKAKNSNGCWAVDAYSVPLIVNPIVLTASATPLTFCSSDNGEVYSTIVNDNKFDYNYFWAKGASVNPPVDYTTNSVSNLPAGTYTVVAIDNLDAACVSPTFTVTVNNEQVIPVVSARVLKNLTMCDPTKPDGEASADVGGDVAHYTFDWYTGSAATGVSFYRGAEVGNLTSTTYTVLGTETSTGCSATASVNVPFTPVIIPAPTVTVISNVTSCIADNGQLSATVDGVTKDYIFDWANGTNPPPPIDFTGEIYKNLSVGQYTVIATSKITGCVSGPAKAPVSNEQKFPEFRFLIQSATCSTQVGHNPTPTKGDGFITLLVSNDLSVEQVFWYQGGSVSNGKVVGGTLVEDGPNLQDAFAGVYQVNVRTTLGCENAKEVKLPVEILPYNGISRRDGSENSYFLINCIDNFENNHVEIFNRAGTKVYEADGYNNSDIVFDGKSNKGISLLGINLPSGTYFYVIDKRDGSKKMVGYLELVD